VGVNNRGAIYETGQINTNQNDFKQNLEVNWHNLKLFSSKSVE
jgi:hypothetical protein